ncbi:MAG TPA: FIST N-terminal domain-containing protein [Pirellulaceae bacterium]|nr:FIST N-terminal domain-containing protein [Pirellulaceae bacterium]
MPTTPLPRFASALSTHSNLDEAIAEVTSQITERLGTTPNLVFVFVSIDRADACEHLASELCDKLGTETLLGCTAESLLGTGAEIEGETALSVWAAALPGVTISPMHLAFERTPDGGLITGWPDDYIDEWPSGTNMFCLGEPFSFPADLMLERLNEDRPGVAVFGGMASGGSVPKENRLLMGRAVHHEGAVAALVSGGSVRIRTVLSQGCRPIGKPMIVTKVERNVVQELGGRAALVQLKEIFDTLPTHEQALVQRGLHLGRVVSEYQDKFEQGDFLVRNVVGIDPKSGAIAVGDYFRTGQTVQFHIRDGHTADDDLKTCLDQAKTAGSQPLGGLLFTCNGRGMHLFGEPHHDAACVQAAFGNIPLAGFFAQGELGPIAGKNFMHGFTASLALFEAT